MLHQGFLSVSGVSAGFLSGECIRPRVPLVQVCRMSKCWPRQAGALFESVVPRGLGALPVPDNRVLLLPEASQAGCGVELLLRSDAAVAVCQCKASRLQPSDTPGTVTEAMHVPYGQPQWTWYHGSHGQPAGYISAVAVFHSRRPPCIDSTACSAAHSPLATHTELQALIKS